jgi:hypothetical protein
MVAPMSDPINRLAEAVIAIKSDENLRKCFIEVLKFGASTQQVRVSVLKRKLQEAGAPDRVLEFVELLGNDKLANAVLQAIDS